MQEESAIRRSEENESSRQGMRKCKGPELGVRSVYSWSRNEDTVAGVREARGEGVRGAEADQTSE